MFGALRCPRSGRAGACATIDAVAYLQSLNTIASLAQTEPYEAVVQQYLTLIGQHPERVEAYQSLALYACMAGQSAAAHHVIDEGLKLDEANARSLYIKARICDEDLDLAPAIALYQRSLVLAPADAKCRFHLSLALLTAGDFTAGAGLYGSRLSAESLAAVGSTPRWRLQNQGLKVLLWAEQGLGDELMFARFLPCLRELSCRFTVQCDRRLISTFSRNHPGLAFIPRGDLAGLLPHFDAQLPLGDLLVIFHERIASPLVRDSTLKPVARPDIAAAFAGHGPAKTFIGLSWLSMNADSGLRRSVPLEQLLGAFSPEQHVLVNLQYLAPAEQLQEIRRSGFELIDAVDAYNDVEGLGAAISHCNTVVTIDNSTLHFAGALGCKTLALIPRLANWRWLLDTEHCYWYPSVELVRQQTAGDWSEVLAGLRRRLAGEPYRAAADS